MSKPPLPARSTRIGPAARLYRLWAHSADWLGARRPLDLVLGASVGLLALALLARLAG